MAATEASRLGGDRLLPARPSNKLIKSAASSGGLRPPCGGAAYLQGVEQTTPQKKHWPQYVEAQSILHLRIWSLLALRKRNILGLRRMKAMKPSLQN